MQRWSEVVTTNLWPFALKNECEIANKVKLKDGLSAEEKYAKGERKQNLDTYHPFSCPVFVLDAAAGKFEQDSTLGSKIKGWCVPGAFSKTCKKCGAGSEHSNWSGFATVPLSF